MGVWKEEGWEGREEKGPLEAGPVEVSLSKDCDKPCQRRGWGYGILRSL